MTLEELQREIQRALRTDLKRAGRLVKTYERRARGTRDPRLRAEAALQRGKLAHGLGNHREAAAAYDAARRGFRERKDLLRVVTGAVQVRALLGDARGTEAEARRLRRLAKGPVEAGGVEIAIGTSLVNLGDERRAETCFRRALDLLRGKGRPLLVAISREWLGLVLAHRGAVREALRELEAALASYGRQGLDAAARAARCNRGWALGVKGDALAALTDFREARHEFAAAGELRRAAIAKADEAELTFRLGARERAAALAKEAATELRKDAPLESARAELLAARASGDLRLARRAQARLRTAGDEAGVAQAALVLGRDLERAERTLLGKGHHLAALDALLARARRATPREGARMLRRRAPSYPAVLRRWVLPDLYHLQGDDRRAFRAAEDLRRRAPTGSLRAATLKAHLHVYESLARKLLDEGDARGAFHVLDAARARTLREEVGREASAAETPRIAGLRARLEALWRSLERREQESGDLRRAEPLLLDEVARCERELVQAMEDAEEPLLATNGRAAMPSDPCLAWSVVEGEVVGFLAADDRVTSWRCGPLAAVREDVDAFRFQVTRGLHGAPDAGPALAALGRLGRALLPPKPPSTRLCVILPPELGIVPVEALLQDATVSYACCAALAARPRGFRGPALAIGLDTERLPEVAREIALVPGAEVLFGATRDEILRALKGKGLVHIAGHAEAREDLPLMSALRVKDGWITAGDFAGRRLRALFVLSACRTGDPSLLWKGETLGGFPRSLLVAGSSGVVASRWEVRDAVAAVWMGYFHERVRHEPPDLAVAAAARFVRGRFPHPADWAAFLCLRGSTT